MLAEEKQRRSELASADINKGICLAAVILAAGRSIRMGRPKLLLPWGENSVIGHLLEQWRLLDAEQIVVVCAKDDKEITKELDRLGFPEANRITNPEPARGMISSIQCAATWSRWKPLITHWALVLGDQPHLRLQTLQQLIQFGAANPDRICQLASNGRGKHPVLLPKISLAELAKSNASNLREFLSAREVGLIETVDPGVDLDLDTPEDYTKALELRTGKRE